MAGLEITGGRQGFCLQIPYSKVLEEEKNLLQLSSVKVEISIWGRKLCSIGTNCAIVVLVIRSFKCFPQQLLFLQRVWEMNSPQQHEAGFTEHILHLVGGVTQRCWNS